MLNKFHHGAVILAIVVGLWGTTGDNARAQFGPERLINRQCSACEVEAAYAADLDEDGDQDMLSASSQDNKIAWYENNGDGDFGAQQLISGRVAEARSVYAADLDGDGDLDVLAASNADNEVIWYENDGGGGFGGQRLITPNAEDVRSVQAADLNSDGDQDVISVSRDEVAWYENNGEGSFAARRVITSVPDPSEARNDPSVHAADMDGDGDLDVLYRDVLEVSWFENSGDGSFGESQIVNGYNYSQSAYPSDLDGDSDLDVAITYLFPDGNNETVWMENEGGGAFDSPNSLPIDDGKGGQSIYSVDLDGDGDQDVIVGDDQADPESRNSRLSWYENGGDGTFGEEQIISGGGAILVRATDLDGDSDFDVFSASGDEVVWFANNGSGGFGGEQAVNSSPDLANPNTVFAEDLDGDGDQDVITGADNVGWYPNDGNGGFGAQRVISTQGAVSVYAADLDGDSDRDVLVASYDPFEGGKVAWYKNDGDGDFGGEELIVDLDEGAVSVRAADLDGDGALDVVATFGYDGSSNDVRIAWFKNNGGTFGFEREIIDYVDAMDIADLDGDSDLDIVAEYTNASPLVWLENDGSGDFRNRGEISSAPQIARNSVHAADINSDGSNDVVFAEDQTYVNHISFLPNSGSGRFGSETEIVDSFDALFLYPYNLTPGQSTGEYIRVEHGDHAHYYPPNRDPDVPLSEFPTRPPGPGERITPDGRIVKVEGAEVDFLLQYNKKVTWYENTGGGTVGTEQVITSNVDIPSRGDRPVHKSIHAADLDGDGDRDVLSTSYRDDKVTWFENLHVDPQTIYVNAEAPSGGDGTSWGAAYRYLQDALARADRGDEIWVAEGTYYPVQGANVSDIVGDRSATFQLKDGVKLYGGFVGTETRRSQRDWRANKTILSGDLEENDNDNVSFDEPTRSENSYHVVTGTGVGDTAVIDGFVITGGNANGPNTADGNADGSGGGMLNGSNVASATSSPMVANCVFESNSARFGGGVANWGKYQERSQPTISNCIFRNNYAQSGGGMYNTRSTPRVTNVVFTGNNAQSGGGMDNTASTPSVANTVFTGNTAQETGGGVHNVIGGGSLFFNTVFSNNTAETGSAIALGAPDSVAVVNSILWGNTASGDTNSQIYRRYERGIVTISYSLIQNSGGSGEAWDDSLGNDEGGNIDADPRFVDADGEDDVAGTSDDNLRLGAFSPAIDAGDAETLPKDVADLNSNGDTEERLPVDLDGEARVKYGTVDMGPYEGEVSYPSDVVSDISLSFDGADEEQDYRLVALPGDVDRPMRSVFEGEDGAQWQAFWDDGSEQEYFVKHDGSETFNFRPGRGFWALGQNELSITEELPTVKLNAKGRHEISLHNGWNIISNPFDRDVAWDVLVAANGGNLQPLWKWDGSFAEADTFRSAKAGEAFYFMNDQGLNTIQIPYPVANPSKTKASSAKHVSVENVPAITLSARRQGSPASKVQVGITPDAEDGIDVFDAFAPPGRFEATRLQLQAPESVGSKRRQNLAYEYRPPAEGGQVFNLVLRTEPGSLVMLEAQGLDAWEGSSVALLSGESGRSYDLRDGVPVTLRPEMDETALQLVVGTPSFVRDKKAEIAPSELKLFPNYPNPFRTRTTIKYALPKQAEVRVVIYDILGRRVRDLVDRKRRAGIHRIRWNGRNEAGQPVASGVYLIRLEVGDEQEFRKVVLVR